jgi:glycosyltransferase involved in cell wall biosynthesis
VLGAQARRAAAAYDVYLPMVYAIPVASGAPVTVCLCQFPYRDPGPEVGAYAAVVCQSDYVRGWIARYWGLEASVVNPPVEVPTAEPSWERKEPLILSAGRFFSGGHSKRQDLLVEAFRELCDAGLQGWELHLAGRVHRDAVHAGYFESVEARAKGYPVTFHTDLDQAALQDLYARASIYWHAAGYGADPDRDPAALEHFGMTTAEAMGHGAVPVAIGRGGQPEVVEDGVTGFLWESVPMLKQRTAELMADPELRRRMGEAARRASFRFSREEFKRRMAELLRPMLADARRGPRS